GVEGAFFINDKIKISDDMELSAGMRLSGYSQVGPFTRYVEDENFQILDTIHYKRNYWITKYVNPEPRLAARYRLNNTSSVKLSYDRTYQYMHMAPLSSVSLPLDIWVPSSAVIKPQFANQYSVGYFRNFLDNAIETSATVYYKDMHNQIEYRQGVIVGYSKGVNYDDNFVFGRGTSYGSEFSVKKNKGKVNGQLAYTLSHTIRKFPDLNNGKTFPAKYDRLHDLSVMMNYVHNSRWTFSTVFVYATGNALNLPIARYIIQGNVINEYGPRNSYRMPAYHRMDVGITYTLKKSKAFESYLILSVYNVYNRRNPYYIYFETKGNLKDYQLSTSIKQVSLFPVIPSITYRFKF
ncbi:MAG TPA: TonB-dependent receptor, partial [Cyclobacteriaceae bacterium]